MAITLLDRKYSVLCFEYTGGTKIFEATFALGCLTPNHIQVYVLDDLDGLGEQNYLDFTYDRITETVTVLSDIVIPSGAENVTLVVQRTVPKEELYLSFNSGADVTRTNIDGMVRYTLMALHEVLDGRWDITFDWEQLNDAYRSLYLLLGSGNSQQVLTKISDAPYDFGWANVGVLPIDNNLSDPGNTATAVPAWSGNIVRVGGDVIYIDIGPNAGWAIGDEFVLQSDLYSTIRLQGGCTVSGTLRDSTNLALNPFPSGVVCRYTGSNTWTFMGDARLL